MADIREGLCKLEDFQDAANPAAILALIEQHKAMRERNSELENALVVMYAAVMDWADHGIGPDPELDGQLLSARALINNPPAPEKDNG